jgi:hypothetical protein
LTLHPADKFHGIRDIERAEGLRGIAAELLAGSDLTSFV